MNQCPPCNQDCAEGRQCPARFDSEDHVCPDSGLGAEQMIGIVLALGAGFAVVAIVAVVSTVGRVAGWW